VKSAAGSVVILDRDGTLVIDRGYLADPLGLEFCPGAADALRLLQSRGCRLLVITNQSGVGRGFFGREDLEAMNVRLRQMVEEVGAHLEGVYSCPHAPQAGCSCRKPALGLMTQAALELGFAPAASIVIGDKESDVEFGRAAGARTILIAAAGSDLCLSTRADVVAPDILEAARAAASSGIVN
jgi:D-glycero-D-manno-heptose 1,7-bisphosphate phosphatase